jgi:tetratricopeptide (TPR) repeat protein
LNVIGKLTLCCLLLGAAMTAMGCSTLENMQRCASVEPDTRIAACTALIEAGHNTAKNLSAYYTNRGTAYTSHRDYASAIEDHNEAIRLNPNNPTAYYNRGDAYYNKGDRDLAIRDYNEAIRLKPDYAFAYVGRGVSYSAKKDYDRAIEDYNEAIRLNPNEGSAYDHRGFAHAREGDYDRAIQDYNEATRLSPNEVSAYFNRGAAYFNKGDYDRAIQDFSEVIRLNPKFTFAYEKRGDAYFFQSNLTAAIANFEDAISAAPSSSAAVYAALMLHLTMKRQGNDDAGQLAKVAAAADLSKWPGPVLKLYLGQMTAEDVMKTANAYIDKQEWYVCEANYFTGEDALLHDHRETALARLKAARDSCPRYDTDYIAALVELNRLGASAVPAK